MNPKWQTALVTRKKNKIQRFHSPITSRPQTNWTFRQLTINTNMPITAVSDVSKTRVIFWFMIHPNRTSNGVTPNAIWILTQQFSCRMSVTTVLVAICADYLVGRITGLVKSWNLSTTFVGIVLIPIVGNAAEQ